MELFRIVLAGDEEHLHKTGILFLSLKAALRISACLTCGKLLRKPNMTISLGAFSALPLNKEGGALDGLDQTI